MSYSTVTGTDIYEVVVDGVSKLTTSNHHFAKKLSELLNITYKAGRDNVLEQVSAIDAKLECGLRLVPIGSELHRQLNVMSPQTDIFYHLYDPVAKSDNYYAHGGSLILSNERLV